MSSWGDSWLSSWGVSWDRVVSPSVPLKVYIYGFVEKETEISGAAPSLSTIFAYGGQTQYLKGKTVRR